MSTLRYDDAELERLLRAGESEAVEFKGSLEGKAPTRIREAICAFANDLPGHGRPGVVFVGVRDDGSPAGLEITDALIRQLADMKTDGNIVPPPTMTVEKRTQGGVDYAVVCVTPSDAPPVRYKNQIWVRTGFRRGIATAQDERVLNEKRCSLDRCFDARPVPRAQLADLDTERFEREYLPAAFPEEVLLTNRRSLEQRLAATKMIASADDPTPTVLGLLVLSPRVRDFLPGAYVQFLRLRGRELGDPIVDAQEVDGPLPDLVRGVEEKLQAHIATAVDIVGGPLETQRHSYPLEALRQLVRNAVMHRSYEGTHSPVRVTWYEDRIEIISPGGPYGTVTRENFAEPGLTDYRNPNLAETMKDLGLVQRFGVGIPKARRLLAENGNPELAFTADDAVVFATVRAIP